MTEEKTYRVAQVAKELNVGHEKIVEFLNKKGFNIKNDPNAKISAHQYELCVEEFIADKIFRDKLISKIKEHFHSPEKEDKTKSKKTKETPLIQEDEKIKPKEKIEIKVKTPKITILGHIDESEKKSIKKETQIQTETKIESTPSEINDKQNKEIDTNLINIEEPKKEDITINGPVVLGKIDLKPEYHKTKEPKKVETYKTKEETQIFKTQKDTKTVEKEEEPKTPEKVEYKPPQKKAEKVFTTKSDSFKKYFIPKKIKPKKHLKKIKQEKVTNQQIQKPTISEKEIEKTITQVKASEKKEMSTYIYRREKREEKKEKYLAELELLEKEKKKIKVSEFVTVSEFASMINVPVNEIIKEFMSLGLPISINQRLDSSYLSLIAEKYGYEIVLIDALEEELAEELEEDKPEDLKPRPPIVTVMGHVDHGKTKLLDYIRNTNVVAGEAGGITQHIGAYSVELPDGRKITFIDTPGHEAFTAMRARGAQVTDIAVIVIAADDGIMPQTIEAINHAQAAGVRMIFAINKIDKPEANPEKVKEQLANLNILVEDWGGNYQCQEISAKLGTNVDKLLEKILFEAELLDLKANPNKRAFGYVLESSLDKGKGYVASLLVKEGTLKIGDIILAGTYYGRVRSMFNERGQKVTQAPPSTPVQVLGLDGAPQAGVKFIVLKEEQKAKEIANKRKQILREQSFKTKKLITLDEISKRLKTGYKELNVIIKGDVDGSVEAISDSLLKLSTDEVKVNVIHKAVGQISESDIMLAVASNAIVVGFQVRPSVEARKLAEQEHVEVRLYSIIYDILDDFKKAIEGMLSPIIKEEITGSAEIKQIFKISKVGNVGGCVVIDGKIQANSNVRLIRNGVVVYTGKIKNLKRFKDDVKEVIQGQECGILLENYQDIKVGDIIEAYTEIETKKKLT